MLVEHSIAIILNGLLFVICTFIVGNMLWIALPGETPGEMIDDFAEFYLDLHSFATEVDFTREEVEKLYKVWQRRIEEDRKIPFHTNKEQ